MHAHFVLAHPEPNSFNAQLVRKGVRSLEASGWSTSVSDLYAMRFDPCERPELYTSYAGQNHVNVQSEQKRASDLDSLPEQVKEELRRLDRADLVVLQYPMWWHLPPAILKGWFDRVWAFGAVYSASKRFEDGRFASKLAMLSVTVGTSPQTYMYDGRSGDIDLLLWPVHFNLAYVGFSVLQPFIAYGIEGGLKYTAPSELESRIHRAFDDFGSIMCDGVLEREQVLFNKKSDWTSEGRISSSARVHSPFVRHIKHLRLS